MGFGEIGGFEFCILYSTFRTASSHLMLCCGREFSFTGHFRDRRIRVIVRQQHILSLGCFDCSSSCMVSVFGRETRFSLVFVS